MLLTSHNAEELFSETYLSFVHRSLVPVAQSFSGGVAIRYVLPVLWMTSHLAIMGHMATSSVALLGWSLMSMSALL